MRLRHGHSCAAVCIGLILCWECGIGRGIALDSGQHCSLPRSLLADVTSFGSSLIQRRADTDRNSRAHLHALAPSARQRGLGVRGGSDGAKKKASSGAAQHARKKKQPSTHFLYNALIAVGVVGAVVAFYRGSAEETKEAATDTDTTQGLPKQGESKLEQSEQTDSKQDVKQEKSKEDSERNDDKEAPHERIERAQHREPTQPDQMDIVSEEGKPDIMEGQPKACGDSECRPQGKPKKEHKGKKDHKEHKEHKIKESTKSKQSAEPTKQTHLTQEVPGKPKKTPQQKQPARVLQSAPEGGLHAPAKATAAEAPQTVAGDAGNNVSNASAAKETPAVQADRVGGTDEQPTKGQIPKENGVREPEVEIRPADDVASTREIKPVIAIVDRLDALRELKELKEKQERQKKLEEERAAAVAAMEDVESKQAKMLEDEEAAEKEFKRLSYKERNRAAKTIGERHWDASSWRARLAAAQEDDAEPPEEAARKKKTNGKKQRAPGKPSDLSAKPTDRAEVGRMSNKLSGHQSSAAAVPASYVREETKSSPRQSDKGSVDDSPFIFDPLDEAELEEALLEASGA